MRLLILAFLITVPLLRAADEPRLVPIDNFEARNNVMQVRKGMEDEILAKEDREKRIAALEARVVTVARNNDPEKRIAEYLKLRQKVTDLQRELKASNARQVELAGMLDAVMASNASMPQVISYLNEARGELRNMGTAYAPTKRRLEHLQFSIKLGIRNVPPPKEYTTSNGVKMKLVRGREISFYISNAPVKLGDVSYGEAVTLVNAISNSEKAQYKLPGIDEIKALRQMKVKMPCAIWSSTKWDGKDLEHDRIAERFGVTQFVVWDANGVLKRDELFGELPEAKYDELGCYVVTSSRTGWLKRWHGILDKTAAEVLD